MLFGDTLCCCHFCGTVYVATRVDVADKAELIGAGEIFKGRDCRGCAGDTYRILVGPLRVPRPIERSASGADASPTGGGL